MTREETLKFIREGRSAIEWRRGKESLFGFTNDHLLSFFVATGSSRTKRTIFGRRKKMYWWSSAGDFESKFNLDYKKDGAFCLDLNSEEQAKADCQSWYDNFLLSRATEV